MRGIFCGVDAMNYDDHFTPRPGHIGAGKGARERNYLHRVLQGIARAGGVRKARSRPFYGSVVGRGSGVARVLRSRDQLSAFRSRRVIVQARIVNLAGRGFRGAQRHLRYIQRDGVTRDGHAGTLYDKAHDNADGRAFIDRAEDDRHQFRFIVSPEDGAEYEDLKSVTRRLMDRMEEDLRTKLDWVAADHYNTGHPHTHVIVRGKDDTGHDLIIAREYIAYGMRERAAEIVSLDLGPRSDFEVQGSLRNEMEQERFTSLDRDLLRGVEADGVVAATGSGAFRQSLRAGRLKKLERLGLAHEIEPGRWQLAATLRSTLQQLGERGDIIKTMHHELTRGNVERAVTDYAIYDPADRNAGKLVGRVQARGLSDELHDRLYLIVDGIDGRAHYIDVGLIDPAELPRTVASPRSCPCAPRRDRPTGPLPRSPRRMKGVTARRSIGNMIRLLRRNSYNPMLGGWKRCDARVPKLNGTTTDRGRSLPITCNASNATSNRNPDLTPSTSKPCRHCRLRNRSRPSERPGWTTN